MSAGLTVGPDGVPGSAEPWASGLRGAVLTGLMTSRWAFEVGSIRAALMPDLYSEVADAIATACAEERARLTAAVESVLNPDGHRNARDFGRAAVWADDVRAALKAADQ